MSRVIMVAHKLATEELSLYQMLTLFNFFAVCIAELIFNEMR